MQRDKKTAVTLLLILLASLSFIGNQVPRHFSLILGIVYFSSFISYAWLSGFEFHRERLLVASGLAARFLLMFSLPSLSDDFYRFLWDGELIKAGISPYNFLPTELPDADFVDANQGLLSGMNSPEYFTVYPPLNQLIFWISVSYTTNWLTAVNAMRVLMISADLGSYILLVSLLGKSKRHLAIWYFLNPLIILEFTGNLHFEGLVIFFLLLTLFWIKRNKWILSGISMGLAIATKLVPLILLPFLTWRYRWRRGTVIAFLALVVFALSLLPSINDGLAGPEESFSLYFKRFEFNASFYYVFREIGFWQKGYNTIGTLGPQLAFVSTLLILLIAIYGSLRKWQTAAVMLFSLTIYFAFATIVHPWYILTLIPLGLLSGYYYPLVWSFLAFFTYMGYEADGYETPVFWIFVEYIAVYSILIYEIWKKNKAHTLLA